MAKDLSRILNYLNEKRGFDFSGYRIPMIDRRVRQRFSSKKCQSYDDYLNYLHENIDELDNLLDVLTINVSRFFNNILTTIIGNVSLAKNQVTPGDEIFDFLNEAEMASTRAQALTRQLLTFAKGGVPVKETASIKDILKESSSFVLRGSKSSCEFSITEDLWSAEVDVGQISQVINNFVINANQAMPMGGGSFRSQR